MAFHEMHDMRNLLILGMCASFRFGVDRRHCLYVTEADRAHGDVSQPTGALAAKK